MSYASSIKRAANELYDEYHRRPGVGYYEAFPIRALVLTPVIAGLVSSGAEFLWTGKSTKGLGFAMGAAPLAVAGVVHQAAKWYWSEESWRLPASCAKRYNDAHFKFHKQWHKQVQYIQKKKEGAIAIGSGALSAVALAGYLKHTKTHTFQIASAIMGLSVAITLFDLVATANFTHTWDENPHGLEKETIKHTINQALAALTSVPAIFGAAVLGSRALGFKATKETGQLAVFAVGGYLALSLVKPIWDTIIGLDEEVDYKPNTRFQFISLIFKIHVKHLGLLIPMIVQGALKQHRFSALSGTKETLQANAMAVKAVALVWLLQQQIAEDLGFLIDDDDDGKTFFSGMKWVVIAGTLWKGV